MIDFIPSGVAPWMIDAARFLNARAVEQTAKAAGVVALSAVKPYPPTGARPPQPFKSDRSRRFFFYALRHGLIDVPYRRGQSRGSQGLGRSWTNTVRNGSEAVIGTAVSYAPLVKGAHQSAYMGSLGWTKIDEDIARVREEIGRVIDFGIRKALGVS